MDNQVEKLKLNVTNIKKYLFKSNKELKNLKLQKKNLFSNIENKETLKSKKTKNLGIKSSFSKITNIATSPIKNISDRIFDFFGLIAFGFLLREIPKIITDINNFFDSDFIKSFGIVIGTIGIGFEYLGDLIEVFPKSKQSELNKELQEIGKESDDALILSNQTDREINLFNQDLENGENNTSSRASNSTQPTANNRQNFQPTSQTPPTILPTSSQSSSSRNTNSGSESRPERRLSTGGTVQEDKSKSSTYRPRISGKLKAANLGMGDGFEDFSFAVNNINQTVERDGNNVLALANLSKNFREWSSLTNLTNRPRETSSTSPGSSASPSSSNFIRQEFPYQSPTGNATIDIAPGQGRDASGEPGLDFSFRDYKNNYALFAGEVVETPVYTGYGQSLRIRSKDPATGKMFDALYAHFPPGGVRVKIGDRISPGQFLGPVGWDHRNDRAVRGAGNMTGPHTSVDFFEPGTLNKYSNSNGVVTSVINRRGRPPAGAITPNQVVPLPNGTRLEPVGTNPGDPLGLGPIINRLERPGGGGGRRLNTTSRSGNQSVFIYAVQPVETFVPFPHPVPIQQASTPRSSSRTPPIWRG